VARKPFEGFMAQGRQKKSSTRRYVEVGLIVLLLPLFLPIIVLALLLHFLNKTIVYLLVWLWWMPQGKDVLLVFSDSPIWRRYMEQEIMPLVARRAVTLNWSERSKWSRWAVAVHVFHTFAGQRDSNPIVILFLPLRPVRVFRFLPAFKDLKHGKAETVEQLRKDLMLAL
jgi:hypothetical protein